MPKLSSLTSTDTVDGTDSVVVNDATDATTKRTLLSTIKSWVTATLDDIGYATFVPTDTPPTFSIARMWYDSDEHCARMYLGASDRVYEFGRENLKYAVQTTGATIADTTVVSLDGAQGNRAKFFTADATDISKVFAYGILTEEVPNNQTGDICIFGDVNGYNTSGFTAGATLFLDPANPGELTETYSYDASLGIPWALARASNSTVNGRVEVHPAHMNVAILRAQNRRSQGSPEGVVTAPVGVECVDETNGVLYIKRSGTGNAGWVVNDLAEVLTRGNDAGGEDIVGIGSADFEGTVTVHDPGDFLDVELSARTRQTTGSIANAGTFTASIGSLVSARFYRVKWMVRIGATLHDYLAAYFVNASGVPAVLDEKAIFDAPTGYTIAASVDTGVLQLDITNNSGSASDVVRVYPIVSRETNA